MKELQGSSYLPLSSIHHFANQAILAPIAVHLIQARKAWEKCGGHTCYIRAQWKRWPIIGKQGGIYAQDEDATKQRQPRWHQRADWISVEEQAAIQLPAMWQPKLEDKLANNCRDKGYNHLKCVKETANGNGVNGFMPGSNKGRNSLSPVRERVLSHQQH